jgi:flagellar biosynthesis protein FlhB
MAGEKTEKPTAKRLKDARKKGQIARSKDLALAAASVAASSVRTSANRSSSTSLQCAVISRPFS